MAVAKINGHRVSTAENKVSRLGIQYLREVITKHGIYNAACVLLKDSELMEKYNLTDAKYYGMIRKLMAIGVIKQAVKRGSSYRKKASLYMLDDRLLKDKYDITMCERSDYHVSKSSKAKDGVKAQEKAKKPLSEKEIAKRLNKVRLGTGFRISGVDDKLVWEALRAQYPQIEYYANLAYELNAKEKDVYNAIYMTPNMHTSASGAITGIGIRATTLFARTSDKHGNLSRSDVLNETFPEGWHEFDVRGSVPRVYHLMKTGEWTDYQDDPYKIMFGSMCSDWASQRRLCKELAMKAMFGGSPKTAVWRDTWRVLQHMQDAIDAKNSGIPGITVDDLRNMQRLLKQSKYRLVSVKNMTAIKNAVSAYTGCTNQVNTEVFLHESCIYIMARIAMHDAGIKCCQCYDAFYVSNSVDDKQIADIIRSCALEYYDTWHIDDENSAATTPAANEAAQEQNAYVVDAIQRHLPVGTFSVSDTYEHLAYRWLVRKAGGDSQLCNDEEEDISCFATTNETPETQPLV